MSKSFIETQFPVSKISKESYKERKAGASQTLTGLGKWWGRKPLLLVRATILGLLMPSSKDPKKDREIFLKLLTMDEEGLLRRKDKALPAKELFLHSPQSLRIRYFDPSSNEEKVIWRGNIGKEDKEELQDNVFKVLSYDDKLKYCLRPEHLEGPSSDTWDEINAHLNTSAHSLQELVNELGIRIFGHTPRVGDAFCGGGSIPFEAARLGCDVYASDLNPAAALLTWASLNIIGGGEKVQKEVREAQEEAFRLADEQITEWGIEHNDKGWRADAYLYCIEARSPNSGYWVPLAPNWIISEKYKVCAVLRPDHANKRYHIDIVTDADSQTFAKAKQGTIRNGELVCPEDPSKSYDISTIRGDRRMDGETRYGLRQWENEDIVPRPEDVFQERLYCVRYIDSDGDRYYLAPGPREWQNEDKVLNLIKERFEEWQEKGYIPSKLIERGYNTEQPVRERGWTHWHHLFNPRQLIYHGLFMQSLMGKGNNERHQKVGGCISIGAAIDNQSRLCGWNPHFSKGPGTTRNVFFNQALNTQYYYGTRSFRGVIDFYLSDLPNEKKLTSEIKVVTSDARENQDTNEFWITDPPYADAINYHELGDFFLSWYEKHIGNIFPEWYSESKAALAVKGTGSSFNQSMVDCYQNFTRHMPDNGAQVVMFTHQDSRVWADLALILWASGLQVTAAWTIQTETDSVGIKSGNYVQGTVIMVLRKQQTNDIAFLSDIQADVEYEVKQELQSMLALDDREDPNFGDTDYQLAAYVAALRVITRYKKTEDIDVHYELSRERQAGEVSEIQKIIDSAVTVACEYLVPGGFDASAWRQLCGEERFYLKGLEIQSHGEYRNGVFQELARGFGLRDYKLFLQTGSANETRLASAVEFNNKELQTEGFGSTLVRHVLFAVRETHKNQSARSGRQWLYNELPDYWGSRLRIIHILSYLQRLGIYLDNWQDDVYAARLLQGYLENDTL